MANEITVSVTLSASKGGVSLSGTTTINADMTGDQMIQNVQICGTALELLNIGDVTPTGFQFVRNMDETNYIELFLEIGGTNLVSKLLPGEPFLGKPGVQLAVRANTAPCNVQAFAIEL